jgi:transposase
MSEAGVVRRRRSQAEAEALVAEFEASGLMREAFCQQRGLAVGTLDKYRRRVHKGKQSSNGSMLPVEVVWSSGRKPNGDAGSDGVLVVELGSGRRIEVRRGFDVGTLERLLTVLDRL